MIDFQTHLLVLVHVNDGLPVSSDLGQVKGLGKVNQVEDILLEARSSETDGSLEELGTDSRVLSDGVGDLVDVGSGSLTDGGESVDGGDSLKEEEVEERGQLDEFWEDALRELSRRYSRTRWGV